MPLKPCYPGHCELNSFNLLRHRPQGGKENRNFYSLLLFDLEQPRVSCLKISESYGFLWLFAGWLKAETCQGVSYIGPVRGIPDSWPSHCSPYQSVLQRALQLAASTSLVPNVWLEC